MRLIQITDCHLEADPEARSRCGVPLRQLEAVVAAVRAAQPDAVIVTGDISNDGSVASYQHARQVFAALECPWFWFGGNHDQPAQMRGIHPVQEVIDLGSWRLVMADTYAAGFAHGELGEARISQLTARLAEDERPTLLAMHHPPLAVGSAWLDGIGLKDSEALWQALAPFAQVKAILCGHIHQAFIGRRQLDRGEVMVYGCLGTADQFLPGVQDFAVDEALGPGFRIVDLTDDTWSTWVERVEIGEFESKTERME